MVNDIIKALSVTLHENFEGVNIYVDNVEQGFETPAFFIFNVESMEDRLLGNRAKRTNLFDIHYFSKTETNEEIQQVASKLYTLLRQIKLLNGSSINGFKLKHEVDEKVLHFFVQYNHIVLHPSEVHETFGELKHNFK